MARLLVLVLLYQVGFFLFAFATYANGGKEFRIPLCTGDGIVWVDGGSIGGDAAPVADQSTEEAAYPVCPLCVPSGAPPVPVIAFEEPPAGDAQTIAWPHEARFSLDPFGTGSARAPPHLA
ncbi:MAG TPA: DUF2946 family protein [Alphaproteobacteria bacterium]|nr:DUF2946 family protein [Alphaproteobacteria bacterium]